MDCQRCGLKSALLQLFREFRISDSAALHRVKQADGVITPTIQIIFELGRASRVSIAHKLKPMQSKYFIYYVQKVDKRRITIPLHTDRVEKDGKR